MIAVLVVLRGAWREYIERSIRPDVKIAVMKDDAPGRDLLRA